MATIGEVHRFFDLLLGPGPGRDRPSRARWLWQPLRLIGPGSVPLAALLVIACVLNYDIYTVHGYAAVLLALAQCGSIVVAGYRPLLGWALAFGGFWVFAATIPPVAPSEPWPWAAPALLAYLVVTFAVARGRGLAVAALAWVVPLLAGTLLAVDKAVAGPTENLQVTAALSGIAVALGAGARMWSQARARLAEEEQLTAEERDRRRLLEERARIARELHDVVAHHMSVIAVQASTAEFRVEDVSETAKEEFRSIGEQARESLTEMRRLLAVLRSEDESGLRSPQPGLERLDSLLDAAERAGTVVRVEQRDVPSDLPEPVSLTAYRIVQEALSNVVRHAPGARTGLTMTGTLDRVVIEVVNEPVATGAVPEWSTEGLGLAGMRERVTLLGGEVSAGPTDDGGFAVNVSLPLGKDVPGEPGRKDGVRTDPSGNNGPAGKSRRVRRRERAGAEGRD